METKRFYYTDGKLTVFDADITSCAENDDGTYSVTLAGTAFFPEGGGQAADTGTIGDAAVTDVRETDGGIIHITDRPLTPGKTYPAAIDREVRLRRMQNHSGEHIISGIVNRLYGLNNIGFHMGREDVTIDFDGVLDRAQLLHVERLANDAVAENRPIKISFPSQKKLENLEYRSKKALSGKVRIVEIEGFDRCACCAPHLARTGEVGIIKILDFIKYKGGVRVHILCGLDALDDYNRRYENTAEISSLLSSKQHEVAAAVRALHEENGALRGECGELRRRLITLRAEGVPETAGNVCLFENADQNGLRLLVNLVLPKCGGICAAFSGDDEHGYKYVIASTKTDLRDEAKRISAALGGRGGGCSAMIQGSVTARAEQIKDFFGV